MEISVIIISYNSGQFLEENLASLTRQTVPFKEIVVVDNHSTDDSLEVIDTFAKDHPALKRITLDFNSGYAAGANTGIRNTHAELVLVANADTIFAANFNDIVIRKFAVDPELAILSPLIMRFDNHTVDSAGQIYSNSLYPKEIGFGQPLAKVDIGEKKIFSVCGAATIFRRSALERLKLDNDYYDEDFFIFWEDFDIGWRAQLLGMKVFFSPAALVCHYRSGTLEKGPRSFVARFSLALARPAFIKFHLVKNRYLTLLKNFRLKQFYWTLPFIIVKDIVWVGLLTIFSPKIIIKLIKSRKLFHGALAKRKILKAKEKEIHHKN
ncbi:MAG: glycosyltransferase family 2 protein [Acidobacteria bacterium]|jgi:GT2 family glycosyltransferase|nr:glycosyltransferase family 2 protein [Acidobacteriota bacterium]